MAAAVAPLQGTLFITTSEGVRRINETELRGVTGAGSLVQRMIQWVLGFIGYLVYLRMRPALKEVAKETPELVGAQA